MPATDDKSQLANPDRRRFLTTAAAAAGGLAVCGIATPSAQAADLVPLKETDALAVSMNYKEDTAKVDAKKFPNHKPAQTCANCQFYQGTGGANGPCQLFPGKSVTAKGWCQVWAQKK